MADPRAGVSVDVLREAARAHLERTVLRDFAAEVGTPWSTLRAFVQGAEPRKKTRRKLTVWYARTGASRGVGPTAEEVRAFVAALVAGIPEKKREAAERRVRDVLAEVYREAGAKLPK